MKTLYTVFFAMLIAGSASAQPGLNFTRIVNNWPTVELYFKVSCDGQPSYPRQKSDFRIFEDGLEVDEFTLWCPDPRQRCAISVAMVFDGSGSMIGSKHDKVVQAGFAFVDLMDGMIDEAAVIWYQSVINVELGMTTNKQDLKDAIQSIPTSGASAMWDGMYVGLQELILSGSNPCRAVIAMCDGFDNSSTHTPDEIIALANRNRIRVYAIAMRSTYDTRLEQIALSTGGRFYFDPTGDDLVDIYQELSTILFSGFLECLITYQAKCQDGATRTVDLLMPDYCDSTISAQRTYRAPRDTSTFRPLLISAKDVGISGGFEFTLPVELVTPINPLANFGPMTMNINFDPNLLQYKGIRLEPGMLLYQQPSNVDVFADHITFELTQFVPLMGQGVLFGVDFLPATVQIDTTTNVTISEESFSRGCFKMIRSDGVVSILSEVKPVISLAGNNPFCEGDSVLLTATSGLTDYIWSNGKQGQSIHITQADTLTVTAKAPGGGTATSDPFVVMMLPAPVPVIQGPVEASFCEGNALILQAEAGLSYYIWSTGDTGIAASITEPGPVTVSAVGANGCRGVSAPVQVTMLAHPNPKIIGAKKVCVVNHYTYQSVDPTDSTIYAWYIQGGTIHNGQGTESVTVEWTDPQGGYLVLAEEFQNGCGLEDTLFVEFFDPQPPVTVIGEIPLCVGSKVTLEAADGYLDYEWSTGETSQSIEVDKPGFYSYVASSGTCSAVSDTLEVTQFAAINPDVQGDTLVCPYAAMAYHAASIPDGDYTWSVDGGKVVSGQGTGSVMIEWVNVQNGSIVIEVERGACVDRDTLAVQIRQVAVPTVTALGSVDLCEGDSLALQAETGYSGYQWSTGATGELVTVNASGSYWYTALDGDGCTMRSDTVDVFVHTVEKPVISINGTTLTCSVFGMALYEWFESGNIFTTDTTNVTTTIGNGVYRVRITDAWGCTNTSDPFSVTAIGKFEQSLARYISVAPNPNNGTFEVALEFDAPTSFTVKVVNALGQSVYQRQSAEKRTFWHQTIRLPESAPGVYFFLLESDGRYDFRKVIVR